MAMEVGLLFSRNGFLALNKPAGMCTWSNPHEHSTDVPQLWELIAMHHKKGRHAHRIDQFTSGINLAGTSETPIRRLMCNWHDNTKKFYLAIIENPMWVEKIIDFPINNGESATTKFTVIERSKPFALVQCELVESGRYHQIRQHLMWIKSPIVGDLKYGGLKTNARPGQMLHAWLMKVRFPDDQFWTSIQAPIPDDFKQFNFNWDRWNAKANQTLGTWKVPTGWRR